MMNKNKIIEEQANISAKQISDRKQDIKFDTRDCIISWLIEKFHQEEFYIPLEYQRRFVWNEEDKCFFIESILIGLPIPLMFFADTEDGRIEIVDGAQRMQTLVEFADNQLTLKNMHILTESNGFKFKDLQIAVQRRFNNSSIRSIFLEQGTTVKTRQEIFKRINTGGRKAKPSETRRGAFEGKFKDFLEECVKDELFNQLAPRTKQTEDRYEGFELVARFFAYSDNYKSNFIGYNGKVALYIDKYVEKQNKECEKNSKIINKCKNKFKIMLKYTEKILGKRGFRKTEQSNSTPRARFEAISIGIILALEENPKLGVKDVTNWIDSEEFAEVTRSDAANNKSKLKARIDFVKNRLLKQD